MFCFLYDSFCLLFSNVRLVFCLISLTLPPVEVDVCVLSFLITCSHIFYILSTSRGGQVIEICSLSSVREYVMLGLCAPSYSTASHLNLENMYIYFLSSLSFFSYPYASEFIIVWQIAENNLPFSFFYD